MKTTEKAKDGGELVWLYYVRYRNEYGKILLVTAARNEEEVKKIFDDKHQDDGYHIEDMIFEQIGFRRFSKKIAQKKIDDTLRTKGLVGKDKPLYN